jgi:hypothetical protein
MNKAREVDLLLEYLHEEMLPGQNVIKIDSCRIGADQHPEFSLQ